jgi:uncharacterized protein YndB with AHSA1/START domain
VNDDYTVTVQREIAAPAEELFDAWLDARSLSTWMKPLGTSESRVETDPRVGGSFRIDMVGNDSCMLHTGTYREIDRPNRLVFTWTSPGTQDRETVVTVTFKPASDVSTLVEIHQIGLPDEGAQKGHTAGWTDILSKLDTERSGGR